MGKSNLNGAWGEALAAQYLQKKRYMIVATNYRCRFGEIDLVAKKGKMLAFVEVKLRTNLSHGLPREYVTRAKQQRIRTTAEVFLAENELDLTARFDVAEVYTDEAHSAQHTKIEYIENAFQ